MKIAHFGQKNCMTTEGGVEVVVAELAMRQVALGHEVTCYNRSGHHISGKTFDVPRVKEWKGIRMKYVFTIPQKGLAAVSSSFFSTLACVFGSYDIVHIHAEGPAFFCGLLVLSKIFNRNLRICWTCHGLDWKREKWHGGIGAKFIKQGEKNIVRYADEIIVLSKGVQKYFENTYGRKTSFIPNGVSKPITRKPNLIKEEFALEGQDYFLYLSRLVPEKRADLLIDAFKQVRTNRKLVISGGVSDSKEYFEELKRKALEDERIIFTGFVEGQKKEELYSNAYVYILPSDLEGMPLCLLEAMSYGNCCLVSDIPECKNVIESCGMTFRHADESSLIERINKCDRDEDLVAQYKGESSEYVLRNFDWNHIVEKIENLYQKI